VIPVAFALLALAPSAEASDESLAETITGTVVAVNEARSTREAQTALAAGRLRLKRDKASSPDGRVARVLAMEGLAEMLAATRWDAAPKRSLPGSLPWLKTRFRGAAAKLATAGELVGASNPRIMWRKLGLKLLPN
jgi:hypothetical protein